MDEPFEIPVLYKGQELLFTAKLLTIGYLHKFQVDVDGQEVFFEPDDGGEYRAMMNPANLEEGQVVAVDLLKAIVAGIEDILK